MSRTAIVGRTIFQPLMGNGNLLHSASRSPIAPPSNPSWGTGTEPSVAGAAVAFRLPTPHGEREPSARARAVYSAASSNPSWGTGTQAHSMTEMMFASFQPLMGNGNRCRRGRAAPYRPLPTPHGERERSAREPPSQLFHTSNPSWGTGTLWPALPLFAVDGFQPLMGNGNTKIEPCVVAS